MVDTNIEFDLAYWSFWRYSFCDGVLLVRSLPWLEILVTIPTSPYVLLSCTSLRTFSAAELTRGFSLDLFLTARDFSREYIDRM